MSTFAGLLTYALAGWTWLDPIAGFVIAAFALKEARKPGKANSSKTTMTTDRSLDRAAWTIAAG